jgi:hypothetical protein
LTSEVGNARLACSNPVEGKNRALTRKQSVVQGGAKFAFNQFGAREEPYLVRKGQHVISARKFSPLRACHGAQPTNIN